ncbi:MAG: hypothetical protein DHS20C16_29220 [Phycisphaerae bacterium]|nr:MAG: hypothetical protein DHS20C16_29220 [Phycisphaerae bacterium]
MRMTENSQTIEDEGLRCPDCDYNLTGLTDEVCPECGEGFSRQQLLDELAGVVAPIPIWSRRDQIGFLSAFGLTVITILFTPVAFARSFPKNADPREAALFSRWCLAIAAVIAIAPYLVEGIEEAIISIVAVAAVVIGVLTCELTIAGVIFAALPRSEKSGTPDAYSQSLAVIRMTRAFLIMSALFICVARVYGLRASELIYPGNTHLYTGFLIIVGYWWLCITCMSYALRKTMTCVVLSAILVPIIVAFSCFMGFVVFFLLGNFVSRVFRLGM